MWNRKEVKAKGKAAFQANYWRCVLVALIMAILFGAGAASGGSSLHNTVEEAGGTAYGYGYDPNVSSDPDPAEITEQLENLENLDMDADPEEIFGALEALRAPSEQAALLPLLLIGGAVLSAAALGGMALTILVFNPLRVSFCHFFTRNADAPSSLRELSRGFTPEWWHNVGTMFLRGLFTFLWSLLFIVPGIVKRYSYRLTPYIQAEHPELKGTEAITLSRKMMKGNKWRAFVFDLSFLGWDILSVITAEILGVFYVNPYKAAAEAELYRAIRAEYYGVPSEPRLPEF